jgi:hypothetical protein
MSGPVVGLVRQVVPHAQSVTIVYPVTVVQPKVQNNRVKNKRVTLGVTYNISYHFIVTAGNSLKKIVSSTKTVNKGNHSDSESQ